MKRHNFKKLKIWQEGMNLVSETYKLVSEFPDTERFNLISQMTRCAVSIPSNIAEGTSKSTNKHFNKYIEDSLGSSFEWETQLIVAHNQEYISTEQFELLEHKIQLLQKMISGFQGGLRSKS
ncbi:four helix bundle protein [Muricauda sp. CAU 1633]|uniref:four helix bundle protein n=1 Tax=Allomuricauda sp. CAU 1633 TaxID=2816036 RepID=UPI001A8BFE4F|nr:four helix bundle protein [Muricauda sp. CAU 1633]MBO0322383.1 four helix bundle protein [Muricauda sp. CAU 1633]